MDLFIVTEMKDVDGGVTVTVPNVDIDLLRSQYRTLLDVRNQEKALMELNFEAPEHFEGLLNFLEHILENHKTEGE